MTNTPGTVVKCYAVITERGPSGWLAKVAHPSEASGAQIFLPDEDHCRVSRMQGLGARTRISKHRIPPGEMNNGQVVAVHVRFLDSEVVRGRYGDEIGVKYLYGDAERWGASLQPKHNQRFANIAAA